MNYDSSCQVCKRGIEVIGREPSSSRQNVCRDMMERNNRSGLVSVFGLALVLLAGSPAALADNALESAERIVEVCLSRHLDDVACQCLSREAGSRFEPEQLQIIAAAMEAGDSASDIHAVLLEQGKPEAEVASFAHRLDTAHIVIGQTCGASFFELPES